MDYDALEIEVHKVETVTIESLMQELGEPFWRVILDGICHDFDTSAEAWAFADEHRPAIADLRARNEALCDIIFRYVDPCDVLPEDDAIVAGALAANREG